MSTSLSFRTWMELGLLALIWGGSFLSIRIALDDIPPLTVVLHRVFWAALLLWGVVWLRGLAVPRGARIWGAFLVMGLLNNVLPFSLMAWGQLHVETGLTAIFNAATALWGVLLAALFLRDERLTSRRALGVGIGFAGVTLAIGPEALAQFDLRAVAQLAILAGTISYGLAAVWARVRLSGLSPLVCAAGMLSGATMMMLPLVLLTDGVPTLALPMRSWGAIAYFALVATALAYLLYYRVLAVAGSGNLMLVTLLIPPVAITLGTWLRDEALAPNALAGFALLAIGLAVLDGRVFGRRSP